MAASNADRSYIHRTVLTVSIAGLVLVGLYLAIYLVRVMLILFAGVLLAVFLSGLTQRISDRLPVPRILVLTGVTLLLFSGLAGAFVLSGPVAQLIDRLPAAIQRLRALVQATPWAQVIMGVLAGATGVLLATPLTVSVIVLVQMLYVEDVLGNQVKILGQH